MADSPLKVAVIGCGRMGRCHAHAITTHSNAKLVALSDAVVDRATTLAQHYQIPAFRAADELCCAVHPHIVVVATPDHLHREATLAAIAAGCHVFCEKPLADNITDAQQMVDAADRADRLLAVNYNRRYGFAYQQGRKLLDTGVLGAVQNLCIQVIDGIPPPAVTRAPDVMLTTLLTHHFDLVRFLAGEVRAVTARFAPEEEGLYRDMVLMLELASGALAIVMGSYREGQKRTSELATVNGRRGSVMLEDVTRAVRWFLLDSDEVRVVRPNPFESGDAFAMTSQQHLHDFLTRAGRREPPAVSGRDGLRGMQIAAAARISHQQGKTVSLTS